MEKEKQEDLLIDESSDIKDESTEDVKKDENKKEESSEKSEKTNSKESEDEASKDEKEEKEEKEEKDSFETQYIRLSADFQNYKKRIEKEKSEIFRSANTRLITDLLPLIDDFDRALAHSSESDTKAFSDGIELIIKRFAEILCKEGLEYIDTTDAMFDPNLHHAVMMEASDEAESGKILQELQKGYKVNGKVIRPSMVKVAE